MQTCDTIQIRVYVVICTWSHSQTPYQYRLCFISSTMACTTTDISDLPCSEKLGLRKTKTF